MKNEMYEVAGIKGEAIRSFKKLSGTAKHNDWMCLIQECILKYEFIPNNSYKNTIR